MQVIEWNQFLEKGLSVGNKFTSITIGVFDGVHRGHQALIEKIISHKEFIPVIITFKENHKNDEPANNIQSFPQKLEVFEQLGVQITLVVDFTEPFRRMKGIEFLEILIKHGNIGFFAVGSGFRCGYQLDTDAKAIGEFFASRSVQFEIVGEVMHDSLPISSSRIRAAVAEGDLQLAQAMLGRSIKL